MAKDKSYRELKIELDEKIAQLESNDISIEDAIAVYKSCKKLIGTLEEYIATAELTIERATESK